MCPLEAKIFSLVFLKTHVIFVFVLKSGYTKEGPTFRFIKDCCCVVECDSFNPRDEKCFGFKNVHGVIYGVKAHSIWL